MKKRIACFVLTLIMLVSLVPTTALTAFAAEKRTVSDEMVEFIKVREGFSKTAYKDNTQWSIGYGTKSEEGATITKEEAEVALKKELAEVDEALNNFAASKGLTFTQQKHDALVSFTYNCGTGWMSASGKFYDAVTKGYTGNDFLYAIGLWANSASVLNKGLLNRRMAEANVYLNGKYATSAPSNYTYVLFDANGGSVGDAKLQAYDSTTQGGVAVKPVPTNGKLYFTGWYTAKTGGEQVTMLDADDAEKTLYAHWADAVTVTVSGNYINVREKASASAGTKILGKVYMGDKLVITEVNDKATWGKIGNGELAGGWIALEYTNYKDALKNKEEDKKDEDDKTEQEKPAEDKVIATGVVSSTTSLKIRSGPSTSKTQVGTLTTGTKVSIFEIKKNVNGHDWGRIDKGWICLTYVTLNTNNDNSSSDDKSEFAPNAVTIKATVKSTTGANVRETADVDSKIVENLKDGAMVVVTEVKTVNGQEWGKVEKGWILMS